ncbi:MAG: FHA domain-containing protein [Proteobacteria bacterium]|nr:FHA domain-containing protein [Pseudomonadota bacterium]
MKIAKIELDNGVSFAIEDFQLPLTIGRGKSCDIRINEPYVSRQHCELFMGTGRTLCLKDMSANGTIVNRRSVGAGESVKISRHSHLEFAGEYSMTVTLTDDDGITLVPSV